MVNKMDFSYKFIEIGIPIKNAYIFIYLLLYYEVRD